MTLRISLPCLNIVNVFLARFSTASSSRDKLEPEYSSSEERRENQGEEEEEEEESSTLLPNLGIYDRFVRLLWSMPCYAG